MKDIIYILLIGSALVSCETRLDPLELKNIAPTLTVNGADNSFVSPNNLEYSTSIKDSVKQGWDYWINYKLLEEQISLPFFASGFKGRTQVDDITITDDTRLLKGEGKINYSAYILGSNNFEYSVIDRYGKESKVQIEIECFDNLPPVANFVVINTPINSPYQYKIDGTDSYDRESKFGGTVNYYRLIIDNDTMFQPQPIFTYFFPSAGNYTIAMDVLDNDSIYSAKKEISYNVQ